MEFSSLILMVLAASVVAAILGHNIKQITKAIDNQAINESQNSPKHGFTNFCDIIINELDTLKMLKIKSNLNQDEILEKIDDLSREIKFIKRMNQNSDNETWGEKLGEFLHKLDDFVSSCFERGEDLADELRAKLKDEFSKI